MARVPLHRLAIEILFIYGFLTWTIQCWDETPFFLAFSDRKFSLVNSLIADLLIFLIFIFSRSNYIKLEHGNIANEYRASIKREKRLKLFDISTTILISFFFVIGIAFLKEIYAKIGIIQFSQMIEFIAQAGFYTDNTDIVGTFILDYLFPIFIPSAILLAILIMISRYYITIPQINIKFKIPIIATTLVFIIPFCVIYNKVILDDIEMDQDWFNKNAIVPTYDLIVRPKKLKNIIVYQVEQYDNSFASKSVGGVLNQSKLPNTENLMLDEKNVHFSDRGPGLMGGMTETKYSIYTTPATLMSMCALPYISTTKMSIAKTNINLYPESICLTDVLTHFGYETTVTFGARFSEWGFGYVFSMHGCNNFTTTWNWKLDRTMLPKFMDNIKNASSGDKPFFAFFATLDNHHPGRICKDCPPDENKFYRACRCTDNKLKDFLKWCEEQPWYNDTVIIIHGDHYARNDQVLTDPGYKDYIRKIFTLHINRQNSNVNAFDRNFRNFTHLDTYPTILAAAGFEIKGDRLGLGTNLYSNKKTILERLNNNIEELEKQLPGSYEWYKRNFLKITCKDNELCIDGTIKAIQPTTTKKKVIVKKVVKRKQ